MWGRNGCVPPFIICLIFRSRVQSVKFFYCAILRRAVRAGFFCLCGKLRKIPLNILSFQRISKELGAILTLLTLNCTPRYGKL